MAYNDRYESETRYVDRDRPYPERDRGRLFRGGDDDRDYSSRQYQGAYPSERKGGWAESISPYSDQSRGRRGERNFGRDDYERGLPVDETRSLIASNKVEGTPVFGRDRNRLGSIKNLMIDKFAGTVRYAVLSHASGFLGLNEEYLPVEWDELRYDESRDGYRINMTEDQVQMRIDRERSSRRDYGRMRDRDERSSVYQR